jgi:hypothetical protein
MTGFTGFRKSAVSTVKNWFTRPRSALEPEVIHRRGPIAPRWEDDGH